MGAGPVGLTTAIALRRGDVRVRIVDRAPGTNREPRADVLFSRAGEALAALGVGEVIRANAYEMRTAKFYSSGRLLGTSTVGRLSTAYPRAMTIEQNEIERLLGEHLNALGAAVEWRTAVTDIHPDPDRVTVSLRLPDGTTETVTAAWVVGCDGPRSTVRERLGIAYEGRPRRNMQVVQGNVVPTWPLSDAPGHGYFFLAPYRSVIAFPTPSGGYRIFCVRDDPDPSQTQQPTLDEFRGLVADAAGIPDLQLTLTEPVWLTRARFADRVAARLRDGRVLLAGDAAHSWAPIGGHGMNIGILGAHNLAWKLIAVHRGEAADALLDTYDVEQRRLAHDVIRDMKRNVMEMLLPALAHRARAAVLRLGLPSERFQLRSEQMMSDLGRHHRHSRLSWQRSRHGGLRAGDRLPDVRVTVDASALTPALPGGAGVGQPVRAHELLGYDRWSVLLRASSADDAKLAELRDACAAASVPMRVLPVSPTDRDGRLLAHPEDFAVVRPDGHVGLVARLDRTDLLRDYIATFLRGSPQPR
ncbi:FAD-dependent oxidoreductase [Luedemannella flava]|uniref:FAD-dependent oxidoreductase n=1 Tax=Luedemannella flava TaxID=349316 RepID=A0ABN2MI68_9ACTN